MNKQTGKYKQMQTWDLLTHHQVLVIKISSEQIF